MCNLLYNLTNISTSCVIIIVKSNNIKQLLNASMCRPMEVFLGLKEQLVNYFCFLKFNPFHATDRFWFPREKIRKPLVFLCFLGVSKEISGMKWVNFTWSSSIGTLRFLFILRYNLLLLRFCALMLFALWRKYYLWCKDVSGGYLQQYLSRFNSCYQQLY